MEKVTDEAQFQVLTARDKLTVILFKANWAQTVCERTRTVLSDMSDYEDFQGISFVECEAEDVQEVCMKYDVAVVPAVLFFRKGRLLDRVDRYNAIELTNKVKHYAGNSEILYGAPEPIVEKNMQNGKAKAGEESEANVSDNGPYKGTPMEQRLQQLINQKEIMLFMKGNRDTPRCGFSNTMIQILNESTVPYGTFDILGDEEVRQALKIYSNWQTYPQLYVRGELIGGLDIVKELRENGELMETLLQPFPGGAATQEGV